MHSYSGGGEEGAAGSRGKRQLSAAVSPRKVRQRGSVSQVLLWGALLVSGVFVLLQMWFAGQLQINFDHFMHADTSMDEIDVAQTPPSQRGLGGTRNLDQDVTLLEEYVPIKSPHSKRGLGALAKYVDHHVTHSENKELPTDGVKSVKSSPSKRWLDGTRIGNVDHLLTKRDVRNLIAIGARGQFSNIIGETVCAEGSPLATSPDLNLTAGFHKWDRETSSQIIYRAYHENQYGPARSEALSRLEDWETWEATRFMTKQKGGKASTQEGVGLFDFECPDAKFLVSDGFTVDVGLGSNLRSWGNAPVMYYGLAHQRVVLYISNENMSLASCDRHDLQCSFLPLSPCVITREELEAAPHAKGDLDVFLNENVNERIIRTRGARSLVEGCTLKWKRPFPKGRDRCGTGLVRYKTKGPDVIGGIQKIITGLYSAYEQNQPHDKNNKRLAQAVREVVAKDFHGIEAMLTIETAAQLFIVRPNRAMREAITGAIKDSFPTNYDPSKAIAMPIRASDKCILEQSCVEFAEYIKQLKVAFPSEEIRYIVLTSEDEKVLHARHEYVSGEDKSGLQFIVNREDVAQGSGYYKKLNPPKRKPTMEEIITSTMTAWAFQLRAGYAFLNRCSNFHRLIESTMDFGCSVATSVKAQGVKCKIAIK